MTYFETPEHYEAHVRGISLDALAAEQEAAEKEQESTWLAERIDPERFVSEDDFDAATPQDWKDLQDVLDWEAFEGH